MWRAPFFLQLTTLHFAMKHSAMCNSPTDHDRHNQRTKRTLVMKWEACHDGSQLSSFTDLLSFSLEAMPITIKTMPNGISSSLSCPSMPGRKNRNPAITQRWVVYFFKRCCFTSRTEFPVLLGLRAPRVKIAASRKLPVQIKRDWMHLQVYMIVTCLPPPPCQNLNKSQIRVLDKVLLRKLDKSHDWIPPLNDL